MLIIDNWRRIERFSIFNILICFNFISFSIEDDETKAAPNPKLTAVLIPSIEFSCRIVLNSFGWILLWINRLSINCLTVEVEFNVIKSKQYKSSFLITFFTAKGCEFEIIKLNSS